MANREPPTTHWGKVETLKLASTQEPRNKVNDSKGHTYKFVKMGQDIQWVSGSI